MSEEKKNCVCFWCVFLGWKRERGEEKRRQKGARDLKRWGR